MMKPKKKKLVPTLFSVETVIKNYYIDRGRNQGLSEMKAYYEATGLSKENKDKIIHWLNLAKNGIEHSKVTDWRFNNTEILGEAIKFLNRIQVLIDAKEEKRG